MLPAAFSQPTALTDLTDRALAASYAYPHWLGPGQSWVRANMVATVDGAVSGGDGLSGSIAPASDRRLFSLLRGMADVVLVGARTAREEHYGPARPRPSAVEEFTAGQHPCPVIAILSRSLDLDLQGPLFTQARERTIVLTVAGCDPARQAAVEEVADVVIAGEQDVDLELAINALARRGLCRVLAEGGPRVLAQIVAAGLLDELCLTVSPLLLAGSSTRILAGDAVQPPARLRLAHVLTGDEAMFTRWVRG